MWAEQQGNVEIIAQTGNGAYRARAMKAVPFVEPEQYDRYSREADLLIAHAGIGSLLTAMEYSKPIIIMPRRAELGEHRNDHQMATVRRFAHVPGVRIAGNETDLAAALLEAKSVGVPPVASRPTELIASLQTFMSDGVLKKSKHGQLS
jgi:UDP-N-acetylglucosamine transferase subunit ALG13